MQQLPKLITSEEVYDLDSFELRDLETAIKSTKTDDTSWNKKAQKLLDLIQLELKERDAVENFAVNIDQYAIYQNDTLKQILDDIKNRPANYLDQIVTNYEKPNQLEKINHHTQEHKRLPPENLSTSTLTQSTANKNTKKKNHLFEFMQDVLKKTDVSNQKFIIGQAVQGRFIPPLPKPKLTTVQKIKTEKEIRKKKKAALSKQNTRASSQSKSIPTAVSVKDETQSLKHSQIKEQQIENILPQKGKLIQTLEDHEKYEKELIQIQDKEIGINLVQTGTDQKQTQLQDQNKASHEYIRKQKIEQELNPTDCSSNIERVPQNDQQPIILQEQQITQQIMSQVGLQDKNKTQMNSDYDQQSSQQIQLDTNKSKILSNDSINTYNTPIEQKQEQQQLKDQWDDSKVQRTTQSQNYSETLQSISEDKTKPNLRKADDDVSFKIQQDKVSYQQKMVIFDEDTYQDKVSYERKMVIYDEDQQQEYMKLEQVIQDIRPQEQIKQTQLQIKQQITQQTQSQVKQQLNSQKSNKVNEKTVENRNKQQTNQRQSQNTIKQQPDIQSRAATQQLSKRSEIEEIVEDCYEGESSDSEPRKIQLQKQLTRKVVASKPAKFVEIKYQKEDMTDIRKACEEMQLDKFMEQPKEEVKKIQERKPRVPIQPAVQAKQQPQSKFIQKMMTIIDDSKLVDYSDIVPSFQHLFSGFYNKVGTYNHLDQMREILSIFQTHIERVDNLDQLLSKYRMNPLSLNPNELVYVNDPRKIISYASKTGIDIQQYIARQMVFNQRLQEDGKPEQYFRVIKTKEEVYDIITRSFMRKQSWTELPHAIGLKTSWNVLWTWAKPQIDLNKLLFFQKVNHFQFNKNLARKDLLKKNIERCQKLGSKTQQIFDIIPTTFLLPKEYVQFMERFYKDGEQEGQYNLWIMKPTSKSRGRGITVVNDVSDVMYAEPVVLQKYLKNPLLLKGHKFDMRIYVLVTSFNPLECFLYKEGFARLTTQPFTLDINEIKNQYVHLTNFAVQKHNVNAGDIDNAFGGCKISLRQLKEKLADKSINWTTIWDQVQEIILKSLVACQSEIPNNANSFELFGYDIIIDTNQKCWLLEVNSSPSLARDYLLDELIKQQLIDDIFDLIEPIHFDRQKLCEVLERRILEEQGCKSAINTMNNSKLQCSRDLNYILKGQNIRKYGEMPKKMGGFMRLAPSDTYDKLKNLVQSYKTVNGRGTID